MSAGQLVEERMTVPASGASPVRFGVPPQVGVLAAFAVVLLGLATWRLRAALAG